MNIAPVGLHNRGNPARQAKPAAGRPDWTAAVSTGTGTTVLGGFLAILLFFAGFGLWAATAPLSGAVMASGIVQASGQNQVVEHLEGGIIARINVREGDRVEAGTTLITLDNTRVLAERNRVGIAILLNEARLARARAELDGRQTLEFSPALIERAQDLRLDEELSEQRAEFDNRLARHRSELAAMDQRINATREEIDGLQIQKQSQEQKLAIIREELADKETLLAAGLTPRSEYNALRRAQTDSQGQIGALTASIGQRRAAIAELVDQRAALSATRREKAAQQMNELRTTIGDLREQLRTRDDILMRSDIRAPVDGVIVTLAKNTIGGTIRPGEPVAEILPAQNELVVEAKIRPQDVDAVRIGQKASLRLTALNTRTTPELDAKVTYLSADRLVESATQQAYYTARLAFDGEGPAASSIKDIYPGMPADVFINSGERTFLEYLVRPLADSFAKAFREE